MTNPTSDVNSATGSGPCESLSPDACSDPVHEFEEHLPSKAIELELRAIEKILLALLPLNPEQSRRAIQYAIDYFHLCERQKHPLDGCVGR